MAKLIKSFEKTRRVNNTVHHQVIELTVTINNEADINDIPYDEFKANLYINGKFISDISHVLDAAGLFTEMVDGVDWAEELANQEKEVEYV